MIGVLKSSIVFSKPTALFIEYFLFFLRILSYYKIFWADKW